MVLKTKPMATLREIFSMLRCFRTALTNFLSDSKKPCDKIGLNSNMQKLIHCSESIFEYRFLSDIIRFKSHYMGLDSFSR